MLELIIGREKRREEGAQNFTKLVELNNSFTYFSRHICATTLRTCKTKHFTNSQTDDQ